MVYAVFKLAVADFFRGKASEATMEQPIKLAIIKRDQPIGNLPPNISFSQTIFKPTNIKTAANPYLIKINRSKTPARRKYMDLNPKIAKMFEVNTIRGSRLIAKIAGTESTAKIMSLISKKTSARKRGVAYISPFLRVKNFCPSIWGCTRKKRFSCRTIKLFSKF